MAENIDYTNSAVNLTNPEDLRNYLSNLRNFKMELASVQDAIDKTIPLDLLGKKATLEGEIDNLLGGIKVVIDSQGSYQDVEAGSYAVKQRKVSLSYDAQIFRSFFPSYAPAVIRETVDTAKLKGLIKGGLVDKESLRMHGVSTETESFVYIIKTV